MTFLAILLFIITFLSLPAAIKIIWNIGIISLFNYFGITVAPITYGIALLIWMIYTFFFGKISSNSKIDSGEELCKEIFSKFTVMWILVGIIYVIVGIIF